MVTDRIKYEYKTLYEKERHFNIKLYELQFQGWEIEGCVSSKRVPNGFIMDTILTCVLKREVNN